MELERILLNKIRQTQKDAVCFFSYVETRGKEDMKVKGGLLGMCRRKTKSKKRVRANEYKRVEFDQSTFHARMEMAGDALFCTTNIC